MKITKTTAFSIGMLVASQALAQTPFVVRDIKVDGLQRIRTATVMDYVKFPKGKLLQDADSAKIIRNLYKTGFFNYVALDRVGDTLVVHVMERATIGEIKVIGNHEVPKEQFNSVLKQSGLVAGEVYDRRVLEDMKRELKELYTSHGKYNATVDIDVQTLPRNRVSIQVKISEGKVASIKEIKIIGNSAFSTYTLMKEFELTPSNLFTLITKKDQYAKEKLDASLQAIQSYYMDRGYLHMKIESQVVSLSPDRKHVYITIRIREGAKYTVSGFNVTGNTILPKAKIESLITIKSGKAFSRNDVTTSVTAIGDALGEVGYGFPKINADPEINEATKTIQIHFSVDVGSKVYVRRIGFEGNSRTADYVLRHAMRQQEASLLNVSKVKESERQLRLLGYLKNVNVQTKPVAGTNNQVDLGYKVEEDSSAEATVSFGYGTNGFMIQTGYNEKNFMGSGKSLGINASRDHYQQDYRLSYFNPYFSSNLGAGFNVFYSRVNPDNYGIGYNTNRTGGEFNFSHIISDKDALNFGVGLTHQTVNTLMAPRALYNKNHQVVRYALPTSEFVNFANLYGTKFNQTVLDAGWTHLGLDRGVFPTKGYAHRLGVTVDLPADSSGLKYYKANYLGHVYIPLGNDFILSLRGVAGYGNGFGSTKVLPFYENYYAGGPGIPGQIRGYETYSVGPSAIKTDITGLPLAHDGDPDPMGGNVLLSSSVALILPQPLSNDVIRTSVFFDAGNVYQRHTPSQFLGTASGPIRQSAGLSVIWRSPFGLLEIGYGRVLNRQPNDELQRLIFSIHSSPL